MAPTSATRKSPVPLEAQSSHASLNLDYFASHSDIPSTIELSQLVVLLRERRSTVLRKRRNLKTDETNVVQGQVLRSEAGGSLLASLLDGTEEVKIDATTSVSPSTLTVPLASPTPARGQFGQATSPSPQIVAPSASPAPSSTGQGPASQQSGAGRTKIKVKRDPDREREGSESVATNGASSAAAGVEQTSARLGSEASPGLEADWDDEAPSRPGRTYQAKRKRQKTSQARDQDELSQSETGSSPQPVASQRASPQRETSWNGRGVGVGLYPGGLGSSSSIKLKLNPTAHTAPMRNDVLNASLRRPSILRGRDDFGGTMSSMQASQAAMWELPKRTAESFIPKAPVSKPMRLFPTRPDEVDVDFAKMDWRERDKERDRLEAAAAASASSSGPGPGQAVVKEGTAASRARDRKQDQVAHHTFQQWIDGWFRTLTEEDLAWFSSKSDELDAFQVPPLGRHYSEVWEEEEANGTLIPTTFFAGAATLGSTAPAPVGAGFAPLNGSLAVSSSTGPGTAGTAVSTSRASSNLGETPKFDPRTLKDDHLYGGSSEDARGGPFTERLLAALLPAVAPPEAAPSGSGGASDGAAASSSGAAPLLNGVSSSLTDRTQDMAEYEERLRRELKAIDVLGDDDIDWSDRADDEVSSTLRKVQRLLRKQMRINELRKTRLFYIAMDRMAYQDYLGCLNSVEREIESGWMKRQLQIKKSMQAQKKKKGSNGTVSTSSNPILNGQAAAASALDVQSVDSPAHAGGVSTPGGSAMMPSSSSIGLERGGGPMRPQFSETLLSAIEKRRQLKYAFEPMFAEKPLAKNTPQTESVYCDLDTS